jgi:hypothetical protein
MNTKEAAALFLTKVDEYDLKIKLVDDEEFTGTIETLLEKILSNESVDISFDIEDQLYTIKISIDEEHALVIYDYHEIFDEISEDIRHIQSFEEGQE